MMDTYPEYIMEKLRQRRGLEEDDISEDEDIMAMSPDVAFDSCRAWEGLLGHGPSISAWIEDIYNIELSDFE